MAKLVFPPRTFVYVPDPRWPWNPRYEMTIEQTGQTVTAESIDCLFAVADGVTKSHCGWRESWGYWDAQVFAALERFRHWVRR